MGYCDHLNLFECSCDICREAYFLDHWYWSCHNEHLIVSITINDNSSTLIEWQSRISQRWKATHALTINDRKKTKENLKGILNPHVTLHNLLPPPWLPSPFRHKPLAHYQRHHHNHVDHHYHHHYQHRLQQPTPLSQAAQCGNAASPLTLGPARSSAQLRPLVRSS